jgi:hypothetical protein
MKSITRGILYLVTGRRVFYTECVKSITSLRAQGNTDRILVFAENPANISGLDVVADVEVRKAPIEGTTGFELSRLLKTCMYELSPFDQTLYLDADTMILRPIEGIWSYIVQAPVAAALDIYPTIADRPKSRWTDEEMAETLRECMPKSKHYNAGILLFRRDPDAARLFVEWKREWEKFRSIDQLAFVRAVSSVGIDIKTIPPEYNSRLRSSPAMLNVVIYHQYGHPHGFREQIRITIIKCAKLLLPTFIYLWMIERRKTLIQRMRGRKI